jgi:hypothetical protein
MRHLSRTSQNCDAQMTLFPAHVTVFPSDVTLGVTPGHAHWRAC